MFMHRVGRLIHRLPFRNHLNASLRPLSIIVFLLLLPAFAQEAVVFEHGTLEVPTYLFERAETVAPLFAVGNSRGLYPYTAFDRSSLAVSPVPVKYEALILENEYVKITVLPELGGRIWSAWDKTRQRDIFYQTGVIKPSAYNQRGAWPVGGLEVYGPYDAHMLTWPGEPWPWALRRNPDGSKTIVLSHIDHFFRNKLTAEFTLRPGHSFIEVTLKLHNRNEVPNRYLLWTNAGVPAGEGTRFVYPMTKTIGHDSADFGEWPVYEGVDLSWYKNNKVMLGVFGLDIYDDFISAYDYEGDFGTICYTNRRIARGIKTWTWGVGEVAKRHLESYTDSGVPYVEVQSGRFVWDGNYEFIQPGQTDGWTEYWYGAGELGGLTTATRDVAVHLQRPGENVAGARLKVFATGNYPHAVLSWQTGDSPESSEGISLRAGEAVAKELRLGIGAADQPIHLTIRDGNQVLLDYTDYPDGKRPPAEFASDSIPRQFGPDDELTTEELFQKGLTQEKLGRVEEAARVYNAALERDENYTAPNLHLGLQALDRLEGERAVDYFQRVLKRDPANGDAHYYLAVTHAEQENFREAERHFYRLLPSSDAFSRRDYGLGLIELKRGNFDRALSLLESSVKLLPLQVSVLEAYAYALRKTGRHADATTLHDRLLEVDPTNAFVYAERSILSDEDPEMLALLHRATGSNAQGYLELAANYMRLSAWDSMDWLLGQAIRSTTFEGRVYPLLYYYRAYALHRGGRLEEANQLITKGAAESLDLQIFPFRRETAAVLNDILNLRPDDANAASLLGDLYYYRSQPEKGLALWRQAVKSDPNHFSSLRNLGWALLQRGSDQEALAYLERAAELRPEHLETTVGLCQLYMQAGNTDSALRVIRAALEREPSSDQLLELHAQVEAQAGNYDLALSILMHHKFGPRHQSYSLLNLYQSIQLLKSYQLASQGLYEQAVKHIEDAASPPSNLGVDDFATLVSTRLLFFKALMEEAAGWKDQALRSWEEVARTTNDDYDGEGLFRAIGLYMTGNKKEASEWFEVFEKVTELRKNDSSPAVRAHAHYLSAIYSIFRGREDQARQDLQRALEIDRSNLFSRQAALWLEAGLFGALSS